MARENYVLQTLLTKGEVTWKPHGNSMTPKIESGDEVVVKSFWDINALVTYKVVRVGDVVFAKVKGNYYLHLLSAIDETQNRYQISNNHGYVNGWVKAENVYGLCIKVKDKILVSEEEQLRRLTV